MLPLLVELRRVVEAHTPTPYAAKLALRCRYFAFDRHDRLRRVHRRLVEAAWDNAGLWCPDMPSDPLGDPAVKDRLVGADLRRLTGGDGLRLVTVLLDRKGRLKRHYYLRVPLDEDGDIVRGTRALCMQAQIDLRRFRSSPALQQMVGSNGWPSDFYQQLAVAIDVPVREVDARFGGLGGPLGLAAALNIGIEHAVKMLAELWSTAKHRRRASREQ
jgi:hypothetical protein